MEVKEIIERRQLEKLALFSLRLALWLSKLEERSNRRARRHRFLLPPPRRLKEAFFNEADAAADLLERLDIFGERDSETIKNIKRFLEDEIVFATEPDLRFQRKLELASPYLISRESPFADRFKMLIEKSIKPYVEPLENSIKRKYLSNRAILSGDMAKSSEIQDADLRKAARDSAFGCLYHNDGRYFEAGDDEFFSAFNDVNKGVAAGILLLRQTKNYVFTNKKGEKKFVTYRLGMHRGEILTGKDKPPRYEDNLAMAKRTRSLTEGDDGRFYLTEEAFEKLNLGKVRKAVEGVVDVVHHVGPFQVKGDYPMGSVYEILWHDGQLPLRPNSKK